MFEWRIHRAFPRPGHEYHVWFIKFANHKIDERFRAEINESDEGFTGYIFTTNDFTGGWNRSTIACPTLPEAQRAVEQAIAQMIAERLGE